MDELCDGRKRYSLTEAKHFVSDVPPGDAAGSVRYVIAAACEACGDWHVRFVERDLMLAEG
jgi:hypothetical protein